MRPLSRVVPLLLLPAALACAPFASPGVDDETEATAREDGAWQWCPTATPASEVQDGALWLQFSEEALYCTRERTTYNVDTETIWGELSHKAQVRLVPSDNFLPFEVGAHDVAMPLCARLSAGDGAAVPHESSLVVEATDQLGREHVTSYYAHSLATPERELGFRMVVSGYRDELDPGLVLDGEPWSVRSPSVDMYLCSTPDCADETARRVGSCSPEGERRERWELSFQGGNLRFSVLTGPNGYEVVALEQAEGVLDGAAFSVDGFFDLAARPTWPWSSARDVAIRLPPTAQGHCGLVVRELYSGGGSPRPVELVLCEGGAGEREERQVLSRNREVEDLDTPEAEAP